jgi:hypothetical protein
MSFVLLLLVLATAFGLVLNLIGKWLRDTGSRRRR